MLTHNRFNTYLVLNFSDINKAQIYKMIYTDSRNHEIEIVMGSNFLNLFKPIKRTEDFHIRKPNDENFSFEIGDKKYIYVGEQVITFETIDRILK